MLIIRQECNTVGHFQEFIIPSKTNPGLDYKVLIHPLDPKNKSFCECEGFHFRKHCSHIDIASNWRCDWIEGKGVRQSIEEQVNHKCPKCGDKTILAVVNE